MNQSQYHTRHVRISDKVWKELDSQWMLARMEKPGLTKQSFLECVLREGLNAERLKNPYPIRKG